MKLIFAGTPEFAATALDAILAAGHEVALVLTQPDRPAGRGLKLQPSPVKQRALRQGIAVAQPHSLKLDGKYPDQAAAARAAIAAVDADAMVVAAYGLILPQWVLDDLRQRPGQFGCLNIHASLLPRWRGAAPIHRAIEAGDAETGVTIMQMDSGLDTGDMLLRTPLPITADTSTASLHDALAALGGRLIVQALQRLADPGLPATPQPEAGVSYAHKIDKAEAAIDWRQPAATIERRIRAFNPFPGAATRLAGETLKIWRAEPIAAAADVNVNVDLGAAAPGQVLSADASGIVVACGPDGRQALRLLELQRPGARRMAVAELLRGFELAAGSRLGDGVGPG